VIYFWQKIHEVKRHVQQFKTSCISDGRRYFGENLGVLGIRGLLHNGGKASPFWNFVLEVLTCLLIGNPGNTNSGRENGSVECVQAANINIGRFRRR
jgi:hypothetical protein